MISQIELGWLSGLLEGEGCFSYNNTRRVGPYIVVVSTDYDTIHKVRRLTKCNNQVTIRRPRNKNHNLVYCIKICGNLAIQWMMTLYSLMSERRKNRIKW